MKKSLGANAVCWAAGVTALRRIGPTATCVLLHMPANTGRVPHVCTYLHALPFVFSHTQLYSSIHCPFRLTGAFRQRRHLEAALSLSRCSQPQIRNEKMTLQEKYCQHQWDMPVSGFHMSLSGGAAILNGVCNVFLIPAC